MAGNSDDLISRLMMIQVKNELQSYQGTLTLAVHIAENGWLPDMGAPEMAQHLETLRQYLATNGNVEDDLFLLRLGLTIPGTQRGIAPPMLVLESNRGGFSNRRQREAAGQITRLQEALAIGRRFLPNLSSDTQMAAVELAKLAQIQSQPDDTDWLEWFSRLSNDEADKLAARALECLDSDEKSVYEVGIRTLQHLACIRQSPLTEACCLALLERAVFWPSSLYRESGERIAEQLANLIEHAGDPLTLNHRLLALAWTRSTTAEQSFGRWTRHLPEWAETLHVPPADCWCLEENGRAQDLAASKQCFRLRPGDNGNSDAICVRTQLDDFCPSCSSRLVWLFDFSQAGLDFENIGLAEAPTMVLCCLNCACYGPAFSRYFADGTAEFISTTEDADTGGASEFQPGTRHLAHVPCPPFACAEPFLLEDASTVGGIPMWLQDAAYPRCIECGRSMGFLAQHDNGPLGEEGIYYAFYCGLCRVSAVSYQQT
ncbi:MAG TPA: hypothetical protein VG125_07050 [Pirellulales bacterium]|jgi:hypothetical protein|nr:hypothetical protein [Pirellulales bacterium]